MRIFASCRPPSRSRASSAERSLVCSVSSHVCGSRSAISAADSGSDHAHDKPAAFPVLRSSGQTQARRQQGQQQQQEVVQLGQQRGTSRGAQAGVKWLVTRGSISPSQDSSSLRRCPIWRSSVLISWMHSTACCRVSTGAASSCSSSRLRLSCACGGQLRMHGVS